MRYSGSKRRFAKYIVPILNGEIEKMKKQYHETIFIDMFMGGANIISEVSHNMKMGIDINGYMIALWNHLQRFGYVDIPHSLTEEEYYEIKKSFLNNNPCVPDWKVGYVATCCSYGGAWFNGYARFNPNKNEDHILEAYRGLKKQVDNFKNLNETIFLEMDYRHFYFVPDIAYVIYCDPPYANTKKYMSDFDNSGFWQWVRETSKRYPNVKIIISEYEAPDDFECIWQMEKKDGMSTTKKGCKQNSKIEKLFLYNN